MISRETIMRNWVRITIIYSFKFYTTSVSSLSVYLSVSLFFSFSSAPYFNLSTKQKYNLAADNKIFVELRNKPSSFTPIRL